MRLPKSRRSKPNPPSRRSNPKQDSRIPDSLARAGPRKPIIDASYSICRLFTGSNSCGWSDKFAVTCKKVASPAYFGKLPLGECTWDVNNKDLPYCHLEETKGKYNLSNIHEWVEAHEYE